MISMIKCNSKETLIIAGILILVSIWFYWITSFVPPMADDFFHSFRILRYGDGSTRVSTVEISSIHDLLDTIANMRYFMNSRLSNASFIALNYIGGLPLIQVVNTVSLALFFLAFPILIFRRLNRYFVLLSIASFFLLIPVWKVTCTWPTASMNYSLGACFLSAFLLGFYRSRDKSANRLTIVFTAACAVLCGMCHEGLSAPLLAAVAWYTVWSAMSHCPRNYKALALYMTCLIVPLIVLLTAPGMTSRISNASDSHGIISRVATMSWIFLLRFWPLWILYLLAVFKHGKNILHSFLFVYSISNIGLAIFSDGMWGGGYFYAGISMLMFSMHTFRNTAIKYAAYGQMVALATLAYVMVSSTCLYAHVSDIMDTVLTEGANSKSVCIDATDEDDVTYTILSQSLPRPTADTDIRSALYAKMYGTPRFEVILNQIQLPFDKEELAKLPKLPSDAAPDWKMYKGMSVILLPEDWVVRPRSKQYGISNNQKYDIVEPCNCISELELLKRLLHKPSIYASMCSVHGVNFWLVSESTAQLDEIHLDITHRVTGEKCHFDLKRP